MTAWGGATVPPSFARGSGDPLYRACGSKGQERGEGQSQGRGWKAEDHGEEEEVRIYLTTSERDDSGECHPLGELWRISSCGI